MKLEAELQKQLIEFVKAEQQANKNLKPLKYSFAVEMLRQIAATEGEITIIAISPANSNVFVKFNFTVDEDVQQC